MSWFRELALSVIAASVLCTVLMSLLPEQGAAVLRLLCGGFLAVILLSHVKKADLSFLEIPVQQEWVQAERYAREGTQYADTELAALIKARCEAYILDKAAQLDVAIDPQVQLTEDSFPVPCAVTVRGQLTGQDRETLSRMLEEDLGIAKEAQQWIG